MSTTTPVETERLDRRTFVLGLLNGLFVILAGAFLDPETVLPAFAMEALPGQNVLWIGVVCAAVNVGWFWPQVFLGRMMETKPYLARYYNIGQALRVFCLALICVVLYFLGISNPMLAFVLIVILLFASSTGGSYGVIPFMCVFRDGLPLQWVGKFFGFRYMIGGLGAFAAGFWIKDLLQGSGGVEYPVSFIYIFGAGSLSVALCGIFFAMIREHPHLAARRTLPMPMHIVRGQRMMRDDANLRRLSKAHALWQTSSGLAFPFVVPFAMKMIDMPVSMAGVLLAMKMLSYSLINPLWGAFSTRYGNRFVLAMGTTQHLSVPAIVLLSPLLPKATLFTCLGVTYDWPLLAIVGACMLMGTSRAAMNVGINSFMVEILPTRKSTTFLAFYYMVILPTMAVPILGALIVGGAERFTLGMSLGIAVAAVMLFEVLRLRDMRPEVDN